jgi:hypothetical protein
VELPPELRAAIKAAADQKGQTLAAWVRAALAAAVAAPRPGADPSLAADRLAAIERRLSALERKGGRGRL